MHPHRLRKAKKTARTKVTAAVVMTQDRGAQ
jgi:hypothetical protein